MCLWKFRRALLVLNTMVCLTLAALLLLSAGHRELATQLEDFLMRSGEL